MIPMRTRAELTKRRNQLFAKLNFLHPSKKHFRKILLAELKEIEQELREAVAEDRLY